MKNELIPGEFENAGEDQPAGTPPSVSAQGSDNTNSSDPKGWRANLQNRHKLLLIFWVALALGAFAYLNYSRPDLFNKLRPGYAEAYTLVNDKISQSADIAINVLPKSNPEEMKSGIAFTPEIKGVWLSQESEKQIVFRPEQKLELGKYYTVTASTSQGTLAKDFYIDEDPRVESVFPRADSETSERTDVTIIFNRPMVPLSSLDADIKKDIPVEISPATPGRFKWISTRVLQFTGENGLIPSANYSVTIKPNFVSMDGLKIAEFTSKFTTKHLRYEDLTRGPASYRQPIAVRFNQPVDLDRTVKEIKLAATSSESTIEFTAEYGTKRVYNKEQKKFEETPDQSVIFVFQKSDRFGRAKYWDYDQGYNLTVKKAYPLQGDIDLEEERVTMISVGGLVKNISAKSDRTVHASQNLFDPQGQLVLDFYEEIDLPKSVIRGGKIEKIEYGEKCEGDETGMEISESVECAKTADKDKLVITYKSGEVGIGENLKLELIDIYNVDGKKINSGVITEEIKAYKSLTVQETFPKSGARGAGLTEFTLCTNNPLVVPDKNDWRKVITAKEDFEIKDWYNSFLVRPEDDRRNVKCQIGAFETRLIMGFMPETDYGLKIDLADAFGQTAKAEADFRTGTMPDKFLNFYHYQKSYSVTAPDKTRLTYSTENMEFVNIHICKLSAEDMLHYLNNKPDYWEGPAAVSRCQRVAEARIDQPKKYWIKNYFRIELKDYFPDTTGHYILTFTNPNYFDRNQQPKRVFERTYLTVSNLSVVEKREELWSDSENKENNLSDRNKAKLKNLYWVARIGDLSSVAGAEVTLYTGDEKNNQVSLRSAGAYRTGETGIAQTPAVEKMYGLIAKSGNDSAIITGAIDKLDWGSNAYTAQMIYLYTDRPIYRPGHQINFKGIYRVGFDGDYEIFKDKKIPVSLFDSGNKEIFKTELDINDFGTFAGEFTLDPAAPLGQYRLEAKGYGYAFFDVEEYVPSAFKLEAKTDKEEYISGDTFNLDIDANYYFGAPVDGGTVEYSLGSQNYYFDKYRDEYFSFGSGWYDCYFGCSYGDMFILRGQAVLDENGQARISQTLDISRLFKNAEDRTSKIFTVYATVKNSAGQAVAIQKPFIYHAGEFYLGANLEKTFIAKDENFSPKVKTVDTDGKVLSVDNIKLKIDKVKWVYARRQEVDGGYYYQWEKKLETVKEQNISTDSGGNWSGNFSLSQEGEYELNLSAADKRDNKITGNLSFYVFGSGQVDVRPTNDDRVEVVTDKQTLDVGETGSLIIKSPYAKAKALISIERGLIFDHQIVDISENLYKFTFPVKEEYIPNVYVSVTLLSDKPEVKYGSQGFNINIKEKELDISVKASKATYLPGEEVVLDFEAKDSKGNPVEAEFSAAVVDMSVLALKGNPKKNPVVFFYNYFPLTVSTVSNLKNVLFEADVPISTKGGGGNDPEDLARKKRGEFKDTAFWRSDIKTGADGRAQVKFSLPDNLTTWQLESLGLTKDTKLGVDYLEFTARKNIMAVPLRPRFIIPGDEFFVGATIFNQTEDRQKLNVSLSDYTLTAGGKTEESVRIDAGKSQTVYFAVSAPLDRLDGEHAFTISAKNDDFEDTVESTIPVRPNETGETVSAADNSTAVRHREYILVPGEAERERGGITVNSSASLAGFLPGGLKAIFTSPYDYTPGIIEKLSAAATIKRGLGLENLPADFGMDEILFENKKYKADEFVPLALDRLFQIYQENNFAYYRGGTPNFYLTVDAFNALMKAKAAGYKINESFARDLFGHINGRINFDQGLQRDPDQQIVTARTLANADYAGLNNTLTARIKAMEKNDKLLKEDLSRQSLIYLAQFLTIKEKDFGKAFKEKVFEIIDNSIEIDSRGAFVPLTSRSIREYYETPVRNTALALDANISAKRGQDINDRLLRWLVRGRDAEGGWGSGVNVLAVMEAMIGYIEWQGENKADFKLEIILDGQTRASYDYTGANFLEQGTTVIPISALNPDIMSYLDFQKTDRNQTANRYYYDLSLKYYLPADRIAPRDEGLTIRRALFALDDKEGKKNLAEVKAGEAVRGHLEIITPKQRNFVMVEDFIPAGFELVNFNLDTADQSLLLSQYEIDNQPVDWEKVWYENNRKFRPDDVQMRDDRLYLFKQRLSEGTYEYDYYLRALVPGEFRRPPAVASEKYFPENFGRTAGEVVEVVR